MAKAKPFDYTTEKAQVRKAGEVFNPNQDLERSRLRYEAQNPVQDKMTQFTDTAKKNGYKINEATGEIINPDKKIVDDFNSQFTTTRYNTDGSIKTGNNKSSAPAPTTQTFEQFTADREKYVKPVDENAIREEVRKAQQARINAINDVYDSMVGEERVAGEGRLGSQRAIAARSGLLESDMGEAQKQNVVTLNNKSLGSIERQRNLEIQSVFSQIDKMTADKVKAQKEEALGKANAYIDYLDGVKTQAKDMVKLAAKNGITLEKLKEQAPEQFKSLLETTGYSEFELGMHLNSERPDPVKYEWHKIGNSLVGVGTDPVTGKAVKTVYGAEDLDLPDSANLEFQTFADGIYYYDKDEPERDTNGNIIFKKAGNKEKDSTPDITEYEYAKSQGYTGSFTDYQKQAANLKVKAGGGGGGGDSIAPGTTLTKSQMNQSKGNYFAANPGKTEDDFNALGSSDKYAWYQGGPEAEEKKFLDSNYFKSLYAGLSADDKAKAMGKNRKDYARVFDRASTEEQNISKDFDSYVDTTLVPMIEQYRNAGYTDKEIFNMMK